MSAFCTTSSRLTLIPNELEGLLPVITVVELLSLILAGEIRGWLDFLSKKERFFFCSFTELAGKAKAVKSGWNEELVLHYQLCLVMEFVPIDSVPDVFVQNL